MEPIREQASTDDYVQSFIDDMICNIVSIAFLMELADCKMRKSPSCFCTEIRDPFDKLAIR